MFPRPSVTDSSSPDLTDDESICHPSTSPAANRIMDILESNNDVEISTDEDDQLMSDLASHASVLSSEIDDLIELSSDESFEAPKPKMSKSNVIDSIFNIKPNEKSTNVWISSKSIDPTHEASSFNLNQFEEATNEPIPSNTTPGQHTLNIGGVEVLFPVKPYSCQIALMFKVITGINKKQNCLLESPTGSGKTLALLCGALAWQRKEKSRIASIVAQEYFSDCPPSPQQPSTSHQPADSKPFVRTLFGERSIYDNVKSESCGGGGDSSPSAFKRPEPEPEHLSDSDAEEDNCEDGLVKIHKRRKVSCGGGDASSASTSNYATPSSITPTKSCQGTPSKNPQQLGKNCETPNGNCHQTPSKSLQKTPETTPGPSNSETPKSIREIRSHLDNLQLRTGMFVDCSLPTIYYGARTHKQIEQVVKEFRRTAYVGEAKMSILSSRDYSCIRDFDRATYKSKNDMCKDVRSSKVGKHGEEKTLCCHYDNRRALTRSSALPPAWDIEELVAGGRQIGSCPYYAARTLAETANIVFCPYNYLIDPGIRESMQINVENDIVILDEAHNIEDVCRESASLTLTRDELTRAINELESQGKYLKPEVGGHVDGLLRDLRNWDYWFVNQIPLLKDTTTSMGECSHTWPGGQFTVSLHNHNIGYANFHAFRDSANYLSNAMRDNSAKLYGISSNTVAMLDGLVTVLGYMFRNGCTDVEDYKPTLVKSFSQTEVSLPDALSWRSSQYRSRAEVQKMSLRLLCMNPAVVFSALTSASCIILSSGTLTPTSSLHSELGAEFPLVLSTAHVIPEDRVWIGSLLTCPDGYSLECTSKGTDYAHTQDALGRILLWVCSKTPNGVLCFLPSYTLMNKLVKRWQETDLWQQLNQTKHVFMESRNVRDHNEIMAGYYSVVGSERGAVLIAVYRGKVSEGMDFKDEQARAVISVGIPYPNTFESMVNNKMKYNDANQRRKLLPGREWLRVQAYRALNQAVGRCVRHRGDWGAVLLVDARFQNSYYTEHLSKWVRNFLGKNHLSWNSLVNNADSLESFMQNMAIRENEDHAL